MTPQVDRMAELDALIAAEGGWRPRKGPRPDRTLAWGERRRQKLEAVAARMRERYGRKQGRRQNG